MRKNEVKRIPYFEPGRIALERPIATQCRLGFITFQEFRRLFEQRKSFERKLVRPCPRCGLETGRIELQAMQWVIPLRCGCLRCDLKWTQDFLGKIQGTWDYIEDIDWYGRK